MREQNPFLPADVTPEAARSLSQKPEDHFCVAARSDQAMGTLWGLYLGDVQAADRKLGSLMEILREPTGTGTIVTIVATMAAAAIIRPPTVDAQQCNIYILFDWHEDVPLLPDPWRHVGDPDRDGDDPEEDWEQDGAWWVTSQEWHFTDEPDKTEDSHSVCGPAGS